jgi:hypothetical protein
VEVFQNVVFKNPDRGYRSVEDKNTTLFRYSVRMPEKAYSFSTELFVGHAVQRGILKQKSLSEVKKYAVVALLALAILLPQVACGQEVQVKDSVVHPPSRAALFSALLPGLGQAYNQRYWKIPLIYGGFAAFGYFIQSNNFRYKLYLDAYNTKYAVSQIEQDDPEYEEKKAALEGNLYGAFKDVPIDRLQYYKNTYRRDRDFFIIMTILFYGINIIDAAVDAHFFTYDVSDNLSLKLQPYAEGCYASFSMRSNVHAGLSFSITF